MDRSKCQNCGRIWKDSELHDIDRLHERVSPGEPMPSGECPVPDCGALCQPYNPQVIPGPYEAKLSDDPLYSSGLRSVGTKKTMRTLRSSART